MKMRRPQLHKGPDVVEPGAPPLHIPPMPEPSLPPIPFLADLSRRAERCCNCINQRSRHLNDGICSAAPAGHCPQWEPGSWS